MKELHNLLFELSNDERMEILVELQRQRLKITHISRKQNIAMPEASRHVQRLSKDKLIEKGVDGLYGLTQFGVLTLSLLSNFLFLSKNRKFFLEYDVSDIPHDFISRIGELNQAEFSDQPLKNIEKVDDMFHEANKFIWILSDHLLKSLIPTINEKLKNPFDARIILPEAAMPPDSKAIIPSTIPGIKKRVLPRVDTLVVVTENFAALSVRNLNSRIDYTGFHGKDDRFIKWCKDLFLYYWEKAKPVVPYT